MKQEKTVIKYSKVLTKKAKNLFGNTVKQVYISTYDLDSMKAEIKQRLDHEEYSVRNTPSQSELSFDGSTIVIVFTTGVAVKLSSSEWGSISIADTNNMTQWEE